MGISALLPLSYIPFISEAILLACMTFALNNV